MKAIWNEVVVADSDDTIEVEGNHYFPPNTVDRQYLEESQSHNKTPGLGDMICYHVQVNGEVAVDAAWSYPNPEKAQEIRGYIAFGKKIDLKRD